MFGANYANDGGAPQPPAAHTWWLPSTDGDPSIGCNNNNNNSNMQSSSAEAPDAMDGGATSLGWAYGDEESLGWNGQPTWPCADASPPFTTPHAIVDDDDNDDALATHHNEDEESQQWRWLSSSQSLAHDDDAQPQKTPTSITVLLPPNLLGHPSHFPADRLQRVLARRAATAAAAWSSPETRPTTPLLLTWHPEAVEGGTLHADRKRSAPTSFPCEEEMMLAHWQPRPRTEDGPVVAPQPPTPAVSVVLPHDWRGAHVGSKRLREEVGGTELLQQEQQQPQVRQRPE